MQQIIATFKYEFGMIPYFGYIDGTHVQIRRSIKDSQDFYCCKQLYSLTVQATFDSRGCFKKLNVNGLGHRMMLRCLQTQQ